MVRSSGKIRPSVMMLILLAAILWPPCKAEPATKIRVEDIKAAVSDYVERNHPWPSGNVRINFPAELSDIVFPQEPVTLEVVSRPEEDFIGDSAFTVKFFSRGTIIKKQTVRVRMEVLTEVVVAARALAKDREVAADDIRVLRKWVRRPPTDFIMAPEEVLGKFLTVNIRPNTEITRNVVKTPLLIKKGKVVRIVLENDCMIITTVGISEENGAIGAVIRVKNISSNRTIYARVRGDSLVQVEL